MSTDSVKPATKAKKKSPAANRAPLKPARANGNPKNKSTHADAVKPKPPRTCGACQCKVSAAARYCRHCGKALSSEVPANPHLPPPSKPWRPSRIPKQRPAPVLAEETLQVPPKPLETGPDQAVVAAPKDVPDPIAPRVWDPVPEVEQRMAQLRVLHDRLRPQLARADLFKRRLRLP